MMELKKVTMQFEDFTALSDVDLTVSKGSAFGLLGSNGAGKSTILRLLAGIYKQSSGAVTVEGKPVFDEISVKKRIFFINDETVQFNNYNLIELKNYYKRFYENFSEELFEKLRETVNLPLYKKLSQFSKGMKRQAIMIVGLACQTDYLLMDEAFDGLDPTMRLIVKKMLVDAMIDRELTTIISSHNLKEIGEICDTVALIHQGKVVFTKELNQIGDQTHKIQVAFSNPMMVDDFSSLNVLHYEANGSVINMIVRGEEVTIRQNIEAMNPIVFDRVPLTLEEVFIYEMEGLGYDSTCIS